MSLQEQNQEFAYNSTRARLNSFDSKLIRYSEKATRVAFDMLRDCDNVDSRVKF